MSAWWASTSLEWKSMAPWWVSIAQWWASILVSLHACRVSLHQSRVLWIQGVPPCLQNNNQDSSAIFIAPLWVSKALGSLQSSRVSLLSSMVTLHVSRVSLYRYELSLQEAQAKPSGLRTLVWAYMSQNELQGSRESLSNASGEPLRHNVSLHYSIFICSKYHHG
jgi:hypothetical protein